MILNLVLVVFLVIINFANTSIDIGNINDIRQELPPELAKTNLTLADAKNLLKEKCLKVAGEVEGERAFSAIEDAATNLTDCVTNIVNFTTLQNEIEELKPKGDLDYVFNKYCKKRPEALHCVETFNDKLLPCLDEDEQEGSNVFMRIIASLLNFICHKDGDRIALFIAEKGPECIESKKNQITHCFNTTFSTYAPKETDSNESKYLPKLTIGPEQCDDMRELEICMVKQLETCEEITPANIVESMFRFIRNETDCNEKTKNSGSVLKPLLFSNIFVVFFVAARKISTFSSTRL